MIKIGKWVEIRRRCLRCVVISPNGSWRRSSAQTVNGGPPQKGRMITWGYHKRLLNLARRSTEKFLAAQISLFALRQRYLREKKRTKNKWVKVTFHRFDSRLPFQAHFGRKLHDWKLSTFCTNGHTFYTERTWRRCCQWTLWLRR